MSKASEWAARLQAIAGDVPAFKFLDDVPIAGVVVSPKTVKLMLNACELDPDDGVRLAHWILDTFGEGP